MRVRLVRRWGSTPAGRSVDVDPTQGRWLIDHAFGVAVAEPAQVHEAPAVVEAESAAGAPGDKASAPATTARTRRRRKATSPES